MNIQLVCVANGEPQASYLQRGFAAFKASAAKHGLEPVILGWGQPWRGLGSKPKLLKRAIEDGTIKSEFILFADAFDVVFAAGIEEIVDRYFHLHDYKKITWNAEMNCFPDADLSGFHPLTMSPWRYFNSGLSIGLTQAYHDIFTQMNVDAWPDDYRKPDGTWHHTNDQGELMKKFLFGQVADNEPRMNLDSRCVLFQTLVGVVPEVLAIDDKGVLNTVTNTRPVIFHANGDKESAVYHKLLNHFGY